ncbi:uncharacterized protein LOC135808634 isoform X2 [Sycon ciliatum]|uniref:uncharacterized protein LOC135808634 isoform X2 n=1 Tax=Sycon ciliatum TaxID=27933 RepID=UPI0031F70BA8
MAAWTILGCVGIAHLLWLSTLLESSVITSPTEAPSPSTLQPASPSANEALQPTSTTSNIATPPEDPCKMPADWLKGYPLGARTLCYAALFPLWWEDVTSISPLPIVPDYCEARLLSSMNYSMNVKYSVDRIGFHVFINPELPPAAVSQFNDAIYQVIINGGLPNTAAVCALVRGADILNPVTLLTTSYLQTDFMGQYVGKIRIINLPITKSQLDRRTLVNYTIPIVPADIFAKYCRIFKCAWTPCPCLSVEIPTDSIDMTMDENGTIRITWAVRPGAVDNIYLVIETVMEKLLWNARMPGSAREITLNKTILPMNSSISVEMWTDFTTARGKSSRAANPAERDFIIDELVWSGWEAVRMEEDSSLNVTVNGAQQIQRRTCTVQPYVSLATKSYLKCLRDAEERKVACPSSLCIPVNGSWSNFSAWTECKQNATAGDNCTVGYQRRWRSCNTPAPQFGGDDCRGAAEENTTCTLPSANCQGDALLATPPPPPPAAAAAAAPAVTSEEVVLLSVCLGLTVLLVLVLAWLTRCYRRAKRPYRERLTQTLSPDDMDQVYVSHYRPTLDTYLQQVRSLTLDRRKRQLLKLVDAMSEQGAIDPVLDIYAINNIQQKQLLIEKYFAAACRTKTWIVVCDERMCKAFTDPHPSTVTWPEKLTTREIQFIKSSDFINVLGVIPSYVDHAVPQECCVPNWFTERHVPITDLRGNGNVRDLLLAINRYWGLGIMDHVGRNAEEETMP